MEPKNLKLIARTEDDLSSPPRGPPRDAGDR